MKKARVIIADDDEDDRQMVLSAFHENGVDLHFDFAVDGHELMNSLTNGQSDGHPLFILLDLNMPKKDGREVLSEIKQDPGLKQIPVIVFTTAKNESEIKKCYELGANTYIVKPDSFEQLRKVVMNLSVYWLDTATIPV